MNLNPSEDSFILDSDITPSTHVGRSVFLQSIDEPTRDGLCSGSPRHIVKSSTPLNVDHQRSQVSSYPFKNSGNGTDDDLCLFSSRLASPQDFGSPRLALAISNRSSTSASLPLTFNSVASRLNR